MAAEFICIGNVRKGLPDNFIRKELQIPAELLFVTGKPKGYEKMSEAELLKNIWWGVYLPEVDYEKYSQEKEVIKPKRRYRKLMILTGLLFLFLVFIEVNLLLWLLTILLIALLWLNQYNYRRINRLKNISWKKFFRRK